jgi:ATP-dependent DNA helicase RecG
MAYRSEPRTCNELQTFCKLFSRDYFRNHILNPLIEAGMKKQTIPDKPNSPKQKYDKVE